MTQARWRSYLRIVAIGLVAIAVAGCSKSYRYKLTVAVNTPDGVKHASSVVEVLVENVVFPERGTFSNLRGEALYLDLGSGARPLVALLTNQIRGYYGWTRYAGPNLEFVCELYNMAPPTNIMDAVATIARQRGPRKIDSGRLPDLVTFADVNNPGSVIQVNPDNLQATLGPGVSWNEITLEVTDEPITTGIKSRLPWLSAYRGKRLDGRTDHGKNTLANTLTIADFAQPRDIEKD
ncbi:hypothetical protein ABIB85_005694 [Bradyrhizobium sp. JR1.5]|uniref:hypothetical protein n=1 Tax=unclassified Bradyrhizobium TaxID=2631580 RepID=UPI003399978D